MVSLLVEVLSLVVRTSPIYDIIFGVVSSELLVFEVPKFLFDFTKNKHKFQLNSLIRMVRKGYLLGRIIILVIRGLKRLIVFPFHDGVAVLGHTDLRHAFMASVFVCPMLVSVIIP